MDEKVKRDKYGDPNEDPLRAKGRRSSENRRYRRQIKAAEDLGIDLYKKKNRTVQQILDNKSPYKFENSQRVNRRAMQQAESKERQRVAKKKQKASDTNKRYAQLVGDMINPVQAGKNIATSAQMATNKAREVLRRMQKDKK